MKGTHVMGIYRETFGRRFANTNYALRGVLKDFKDYPYIDLLYDIACQYKINSVNRFAKHWPEFVDTIRRMRMFLNKLHGHGHVPNCQYENSIDYQPCVGRTHGERIESGWNEGNRASASSSEMGTAHRHEYLCDVFNEWNRQQLMKLGMLACLLRRRFLTGMRSSISLRLVQEGDQRGSKEERSFRRRDEQDGPFESGEMESDERRSNSRGRKHRQRISP